MDPKRATVRGPTHRIASLVAAIVCIFATIANGAPAHAADGPVYGIVVGYNGAIPGAQPLEFADDDALKWAAVLRLFADDVSLLTEIDDDTASRWGFRDHGLSVALPPTRTQLRAVFARYNRPGARIIYVHVSHGMADTEERGGEGFVKMAPDPLTDPRGRLYRSDLRRELVDALNPSGRLDLILDSCSAEALVRRGEDTAERVAEALTRDDVSARPNVGVIAATRKGQQVNESREIGGSYFSLVLRSALLGAADPDRRGPIQYSHLQVALQVAQRTSDRPREVFEPWVSPPGGKWGAAFVDWRAASEPRALLRLGADLEGHIQVFDGKRQFWAAFGKSSGHVVDLIGVPGETYFVYPKLTEPGRVWVAAPRRTPYDELSQPTPVLAARGDEPPPPYTGKLHCKVFEGYALANGWPPPVCEGVRRAPKSPSSFRLGVAYGLADAPFQRLNVSHGLIVSGEVSVSGRVRAIVMSRFEYATESGAAPYETLWGFGIGLGFEAVAIQLDRLEVGASLTAGWAPLFAAGDDGSAEQRWADGFMEAALLSRWWFSDIAGVLSLGVSLDARPTEGWIGLDPRVYLRLALEIGL